MRRKRKGSFPSSLIVAGTGWMGLSGLGLILGGDRGSQLIAVASSVIVFYGFILQQQRRNDKDDSDDE